MLGAILGKKKTPEQLATMRKAVAEEFEIKAFTCDDCELVSTCRLVFDPYNTDGDCLAEK